MEPFKNMDMKDFQCNPFELIGDDWMLITAEKDGKVNTMTASWGGLGIMWHHKVAYIFVRHSRFTKEFIDQSDTFSLTFFDTEKYRKTMGYLGKVSGRDENKIEKAGLHVKEENGIPYFEEANMVLLCRKLSRHYLSPEGFLDSEIDGKWYGDKNYHDMYIGEITQIMRK